MPLPNENNWSFTGLGHDDAACAKHLATAPATEDLLSALGERFDTAMRSGDVRLGRERAKKNPQDFRVVVQFYLGAPLFNWFFNARTGYRAHFWASKEDGLAFNAQIIEIVRRHPLMADDAMFRGRAIDVDFNDYGEVQIPGYFVKASLDPFLSKAWFCGNRLDMAGEITAIAPSVTRPKIGLENNTSWTTIYAESDDVAWLDIKGAFVGPNGPYQLKCPIKRAEGLQRSGSA